MIRKRHFHIRCLFHIVVFSLSLISCVKERISSGDKETVMRIPEGFPPMVTPDDNQYSMERWLLGKRLFYDKSLSLNNTISCASCHRQELAFSDSKAFSPGDLGATGSSNAPTLTNIGYHPYFTRAGGVPTLEMQVLVPIQEHNELNTSILTIVEKLKADNSYQKMAKAAYDRMIDPFVITRALACFERSIISGDSRYDAYTYKNDKSALAANEVRGMQLFHSSRTGCSGCHSGFNFTNYSFENNGLYLEYADSGRMRFTHSEQDRAKFKVPTLRNIALTAPYMHDGSITTLEMVVAHYDAGGATHPHKSELVRPLYLTPQEKEDLIAFLKSLSDYELVTSKKFKNDP